MNKKQITAVLEGLVERIAKANSCDENTARALLGLHLKREEAAIVAANSPPKPAVSSQETAADKSAS